MHPCLERGLSLARKSLGRLGPSRPRSTPKRSGSYERFAARSSLPNSSPAGSASFVAASQLARFRQWRSSKSRTVRSSSAFNWSGEGPSYKAAPDHEFPADAHDAELLVPHRRGRIPARSRHARLDEVPDDGEQPLQRFRLDRQVAPRGEGDEGLAGSVEKVDCDRPRALLRALASSHGILSTVPIRSTGKGGSWSSEALPAVAARRENRATEV